MDIEATARPAPDPLTLCGLAPLMARTGGESGVVVGLIDGPIAADHPDLEGSHIRSLAPAAAGPGGATLDATRHGTFVAGILAGRRGSAAPAICPGCAIVSRPVFTAGAAPGGDVRSTAIALAAAIDDCVAAGARVLNVSAALTSPLEAGVARLAASLDRASRRGVLVVAAAGNDGRVGGSPITAHYGVVPVAACTRDGRPARYSTLGLGIGRRGLSAPGDRITSLVPGGTVTWSGTSAAAPFVTGALALLWSTAPRASAHAIRSALLAAGVVRRGSVVPPLMDAWAAHRLLHGGRR